MKPAVTPISGSRYGDRPCEGCGGTADVELRVGTGTNLVNVIALCQTCVSEIGQQTAALP